MVWPAIIAAGASLIGGAMNNRATGKANDQNAAIQRQGINAQLRINADNLRQARELNEQARLDNASEIQRRVADARKAGIAPLAALGAQTSSPAYALPQSVAPTYTPNRMPSTGVGDAFLSMAPVIAAMQGENARNEVLKSEAELNRARKDEILMSMASSAVQRASQKPNKDGSGLVQDKVVKREMVGPNQGRFQTSQSTTAERVESEYGGIAGEVYGLYRLLNDNVNANNARKSEVPPLFKKPEKRSTQYRRSKSGVDIRTGSFRDKLDRWYHNRGARN